MNRREKQISAMLANGLTSHKICLKTGLSLKYVRNLIVKLNQVSRGDLPDVEVVERNRKEPVRCTQQEHCKCVLCEARRWKLKNTKFRSEFGDAGRGPASHDGRVVRQQIGRV